jgi:predicted DNA-binding protein
MTTLQINLTSPQIDALHKLSEQTGKTEDELLQEAVAKLVGEVSKAEGERQKRLNRLRRAKGIWKDRDDLPNFEKLRAEWDRFD